MFIGNNLSRNFFSYFGKIVLKIEGFWKICTGGYPGI